MVKRNYILFCNRHLSIIGFFFLWPMLESATVTLSWNANKEPDLAGYNVYYGERSRDYREKIYVGNVTQFNVSNLERGRRYYFAVTAVDFSGNESDYSAEVGTVIPESGGGQSGEPQAQVLSLSAYNFPNPFRVSSEITTIRYELLMASEVTVEILDSNSDLVKTIAKNEFKRAGEHTEERWNGTNWNGDPVANGVYFCSIQAGNERRIIKIAAIH